MRKGLQAQRQYGVRGMICSLTLFLCFAEIFI